MAPGAFEYGVVAVLLVLFALVLQAQWKGRRRWNVAEWARGMDLELTPRNEGLVRSYIARTRALRLAGAVVGFFVPMVYQAYVGRPPPVPVDFTLLDALLGYLVGAVLAEITIKRPKADVPTASLTPRRLGDYVPAGFTTGLRLAAAVALALVPLYRLLPARENLVDLSDLPREIVLVPTIVLIAVGVELLQHYIVARPQPVVDGDVVRADDAIRSASVHALAGAGIALELLIVSVQLLGLAVVSDIQMLRWTLPWLSLICFGVALGSWVHLTRPFHRGEWHVHEGTRA